MLTKDLLEVVKRKPNIRPRFREIEAYRSVAETVIETYRDAARAEKTRGELEDDVATHETHDTFKLVRGLSTLLERRATFEERAPAPPEALRAAVFDRGVVVDEAERDAVLGAVADEFDLTPDEVARGLWADRDVADVLVAVPSTEPETLLRQYNESLAQTLLFDAVELEFSVSDNYQEIFSRLTRLGLMYLVDEELSVTVTGPAALFSRTRKYGTAMAKLLPSIMKADEWEITAQIETEVGDETRVYEWTLTSADSHLFPERTAPETFDSEVERDFATRIGPLADGWTVVREPTILRAGTRVMIPDFSFVYDHGDGEPACYLEVIGFWTPEYLKTKLEKVRAVESSYPMLLAVDESLNCTEETFADANVADVFFYDGSIPVKPVLSRLGEIEEQIVADDLEALRRADVTVPLEAVTPIDALAEEHDCAPDAMRRYLADNAPGTVSNDRYVPPTVLTDIREAIATLDEPTLADVAPVLDRHGVAHTILEEIGYTIDYSTLNRDEATVRPAE